MPTGRKKIVDLMAKEAAAKKKPAAKKAEVIPDPHAGIFGNAVPSLPSVHESDYGPGRSGYGDPRGFKKPKPRNYKRPPKPKPPMGMGIPGLKPGEHHPSEIPLVLPKRPKKK